MTCIEPNIAKVIESDKEKNARHETLDISFGPCGISITSSGLVVNPRNGVTAKTSYGENCWMLEARFPVGTPLQAGTRWPAAMNRWSYSGGEWGSTWSDLLQFQGLNGGPWANASAVEWKDACLAAGETQEIEAKLNSEFDGEAKRYAENRKRIADFEERTKGRENLADPKKGARHANCVSYARYYEIAWKEPIEFNSVRVPSTWQGRRRICPWFSLEWWDGSQYRLIEEAKHNQFETTVFEFSPIKSSRLRMTIWDDRSCTEGWHDARGMLDPMEVYKK